MKFFMAFKQIHSSCSSFSSSDVNLKQILKKNKIDFDLEVGKTINSSNYPFLNGETIKYIEEDKQFFCINLEADKTFYYNRDFRTDCSKTDQFKDLVQKYVDAGWDKNKRYSEENNYI